MSTPQRRQPVGVIARLLAEPHRFSFFQAVRLLNRWFGARDSDAPSAPLTKRVHFRNTLSLSFPASEIAEFKPLAAETGPEIDHIEITPAFMSLLGSSGALPIFYTEMLAEREMYHRDTGARAFLDVFQHRAVSLFYEAWRKNRLPLQYESDQRGRFLPLVLALAGLGQDSLRNLAALNHAGEKQASEMRQRGDVDLKHSEDFVEIFAIKSTVSAEAGVVDEEVDGDAAARQF